MVKKSLPWLLSLTLAVLLLQGAARPGYGAGSGAGSPAAMVKRIASLAREAAPHTGRGRIRPAVMEAMLRVPRHAFVPRRLQPHAYRDRPLPIGYGQTISQPYIVALMTDLLDPRPGQTILEVGTGSGYQAAVLASLGVEVFTMEIIAPLAHPARERLSRLGYRNAHVLIGDGYHGWPARAPYDAIVVTAAAGSIPPPLIAQLKPGGRMVIPVGSPFATQQLVLVTKDDQGLVRTRRILPVAFVPLTRKP